jgi:hypothetical protein
VAITIENDGDNNRENEFQNEQWSVLIQVNDRRWQRQVRLKMSDYGEKTNGFYQNNMIFGCVLRERAHTYCMT